MQNQITSNYSKISNPSRNKPVLSQETINQIMSDDVYTRLGVPRNSSIDAIKKSYKRRALLVHPDKCHLKNADDLFNRLKEAYDSILNDHESIKSDSDQASDNDRTSFESASTFSDEPVNYDGYSFGDLFGVNEPVPNEFKDEFFSYYLIKYKTINFDELLYPGFNQYLKTVLSVHNINLSEEDSRSVQFLDQVALVNMSLKPKHAGFLTRRVFVAMPLRFSSKHVPSVHYGQEWLTPFRIMNHPNLKIMRRRSPDSDRTKEIFFALKTYLTESQ